MTPVRAVVVGGVLALVCALAVILSGRQLQIASTDRVDNNQFAAVLGPAQHICQYNEDVPPGATALRMTIGDYDKPGPPLSFDITAARKVAGTSQVQEIARGHLAAGWAQGAVLVPITRVRSEVSGAAVCIANHGRTPVAIAGLPDSVGDFGLYDIQDGVNAPVEVRIDYMLPGRPSWFGMLATLAHRMTLGKGSYIGILGWLAPLMLVLALSAIAVRTLFAQEREE
jgi:hypothetical protein